MRRPATHCFVRDYYVVPCRSTSIVGHGGVNVGCLVRRSDRDSFEVESGSRRSPRGEEEVGSRGKKKLTGCRSA
jgi:hypothetical protein